MSSGATAIQIEGLTKDYGRHRALDNLTMQVESGEIFGFLGSNGAGKTTTIRLLLDLIRPTAGRAAVLGYDCRRASHLVRDVCGYLPGEIRLWAGWTGAETVRFFARLRSAPEHVAQAEELARRLELDLTGHVSAYSKGNRQKLGFVLTLMHQPRVLILDEPTSGLDPFMQMEVWQILREQADAGVAVFFSSHVMGEVEQICERVAILRAGHLVAVEPISRLKGRSLRRLEIAFRHAPPDGVLTGPGVREITRSDSTVTYEVESGMDAFIKQLAHYDVKDLRTEQLSLEDILLTYYRDSAP